jgi:hypothetical protein
MKRRMPPEPCVRCGKPTSGRRDGRPTCLRCWLELTERNQDKKIREMGKLKGTHGSPL